MSLYNFDANTVQHMTEKRNKYTILVAKLHRRPVLVADWLLRLWVRIPPEAWMFGVSVVCCQVEVSAMG